MARLAILLTVLLAASSAFADALQTAADAPTQFPQPALPESHARQHFKTLSKDALKAAAVEARKEVRDEALKAPPKANAEKRPAAENIQRLEEIRIFDKVDPEDYVAPKTAPMLVFRATLDKQRPMTPKEITQLGLCFIGLCGIYGPDGAPVDSGAAYRQEARKDATTVELSRVRGTLQ
jgi:hypothetical protein